LVCVDLFRPARRIVMSLRSRIALVATVLVLAAVLVNTLLQGLAARWAVLQEASDSGNSIAETLARTVSFAEHVPRQVEAEIGRQMLTQARLVAEFVPVAEKAGLDAAEISRRLRRAAVPGGAELLATDAAGRVVAWTATDGESFVFSPDPVRQPQAHVFWKLLAGDSPGIVQEARTREIDDRVFKYVGVGGVDGPRIVQVGMEATFLEAITQQLGLERLLDELVAGRRVAGGRVGGDVREIRVLDPQLGTVVGRGRDAAGTLSDSPPALPAGDAVLARDGIAASRPVGRFEAGGYRVAAPVRLADGRTGGAVLVTVSAESSRAVLWWQAAAAGLAGLAVGIPGVVAALWLARSIAEPVRQAAGVAEAIAAGDLTLSVPCGGSREAGRLLGAFGRMTAAVKGLVGRMQAAGARLTSVEADAAAALARQERVVRTFRGSAEEIAAAVGGISATSEELLAATSRVSEVSREAASAADEGRSGLESMTASMQQLDEAMNAFTRKLSTISQRAGGITAVVTTIAKVADQTNLLSVNATIEAEKAGESGRGFRIVAQEIRRLADQTALATKDIERMVRDMQAAVSSGTMEMDRFRNEVSQRIGEVAGVSETLGRILEPVQSVTRSLGQVHQGMEAQSRGARQIRDAMAALKDGAGESADALASASRSLDELRRSIAELNAEAARFRTASEITAAD
jgi:methyl-accepting chemotaxis protein